jgi:hypothetical protein
MLCPFKRATAKAIQQTTAGQSVSKIEKYTPVRNALSPKAEAFSVVVTALISNSEIHPPV